MTGQLTALNRVAGAPDFGGEKFQCDGTRLNIMDKEEARVRR